MYKWISWWLYHSNPQGDPCGRCTHLCHSPCICMVERHSVMHVVHLMQRWNKGLKSEVTLYTNYLQIGCTKNDAAPFILCRSYYKKKTHFQVDSIFRCYCLCLPGICFWWDFSIKTIPQDPSTPQSIFVAVAALSTQDGNKISTSVIRSIIRVLKLLVSWCDVSKQVELVDLRILGCMYICPVFVCSIL